MDVHSHPKFLKACNLLRSELNEGNKKRKSGRIKESCRTILRSQNFRCATIGEVRGGASLPWSRVQEWFGKT